MIFQIQNLFHNAGQQIGKRLRFEHNTTFRLLSITTNSDLSLTKRSLHGVTAPPPNNIPTFVDSTSRIAPHQDHLKTEHLAFYVMYYIEYGSRQTRGFKTGLTLSELQVFVKLLFKVNQNSYIFNH